MDTGLITVLSVVISSVSLALIICLVKTIKSKNDETELTVSVIRRRTNRVCLTNQDDDVWNISSRVNQQNQDGTPPNWPTHDHRLSMDFVITPEYNIKDTRPPPPPYSELDLPSYEQATGCRPPRADLTPVHQQSDQNRPGPSS
ncbi:uncharacterized protein [Onthophagus taurus]|uniref:uncharacterized protein isoform X11 n=1 Tax=Onthophagus taurus TaxID=166361 RepID=UPI000C209BC6|nr:uncharacterized protein LOC111415269 isoform X6 [Onthophagus taurus]